MAQKSKALKALGLDTDTLLKSFLNVKKDSDGCLHYNEHIQFWRGLNLESKGKDSTKYLSCLFDSLMDILDSIEKAKDKPIKPHLSIDALINTIIFVSLFFKINGKDLTKVITRWEKNKKIYAKLSPTGDEIVRVVKKRFTDESLVSLLIFATTLHSQDHFHVLSDEVEYPTMKDSDINSGEYSFMYPKLRQLALDEGPIKIREIIDKSLDLLLTVPQHMTINSKLSETTLLAIIHIIKEMIMIAPLVDEKLIQKAFTELQPFSLWPNPFGMSVRELLTILRQEHLAPGNSLRRRLDQDSCQATCLNHEQNKCYPLYFIMDGKSPQTASFAQLLSMLNYEQLGSDALMVGGLTGDPVRILSPETYACLLLNIFHNEENIEVTPELVHKIKKIEAEKLTRIYKKCIRIFGKALAQRPTQAKRVRAEELINIKKEILDTEDSIGENFHGDLPHSYIPPINPVSHFGISSEIKYGKPSKESIDKLGRVPFLPVPMYRLLHKMISENSRVGSEDTPVEVRVLIMGNDSLLHNFLCAYAELSIANSDLFKNVDLVIGILPINKNGFASFLARHDSWYNRHILTPFHPKGHLLPQIRTMEVTNPVHLEEEVKKSPSPSLFFSSICDIYFREARYEFNPFIYQVNAWEQSIKQAKKLGVTKSQHAVVDQVIPFIQRFEIGPIVTARQYQLMKSLHDMPIDQVMKKIVYNPVDLKITYTPVDFDGSAKSVVHDELMLYNRIVAANIPQNNDVCFPSNPISGWLEMYIQPSEKSKAKIKGRRSDTRFHVRSIDITCAEDDQHFFILVDNSEVFGPFHHVTISPIIYENDTLILPMRTFFPLNL